MSSDIPRLRRGGRSVRTSIGVFVVLAFTLIASPGQPPLELAPPPREIAITRPAKLAHPNTITISGTVIDQLDRTPVGGATVVLRGAAGEIAGRAGADGGFTIAVAPGTYRAYVRDDVVMSIGLAERVRLDARPRPELAGVPDESLMPIVAANDDTPNVELGVVHGGTITGTITDGMAAPIPHAVVRVIHPRLRPVLGTDLAIADDRGNFSLRLPPGHYLVEASHADYAQRQSFEPGGVDLAAGANVTISLGLVRGCIVTGRVVRADGALSTDGAIEQQLLGDTSFGPAGRIDPDGTFRWSTIDVNDIALRSWPWQSPPSQARHFNCKDGARFKDVVLHQPAQRPDLEGVLVDASGAPVPFGYLDVKPLDDATVIGQQERADADGHWEVYDMPPGRYEITATARRRGIVVATVASPRDGVRLQLGGTGRISGTTTALADGSFEASFVACTDALDAASQPLAVAHEPRIVIVTGGRFAIDDAPACHLMLVARWRGATIPIAVAVAAGETSHVELDVGPPRAKLVHGVVRDGHGEPVALARVTAMVDSRESATARTDDAGRYSLRTFGGATLTATTDDRVARGVVGRANVVDEQLDLVTQ